MSAWRKLPLTWEEITAVKVQLRDIRNNLPSVVPLITQPAAQIPFSFPLSNLLFLPSSQELPHSITTLLSEALCTKGAGLEVGVSGHYKAPVSPGRLCTSV